MLIENEVGTLKSIDLDLMHLFVDMAISTNHMCQSWVSRLGVAVLHLSRINILFHQAIEGMFMLIDQYRSSSPGKNSQDIVLCL